MITFRLNFASVSSPWLLARTGKGLFFVVGQTRSTIETAGDQTSLKKKIDKISTLKKHFQKLGSCKN